MGVWCLPHRAVSSEASLSVRPSVRPCLSFHSSRSRTTAPVGLGRRVFLLHLPLKVLTVHVNVGNFFSCLSWVSKENLIYLKGG